MNEGRLHALCRLRQKKTVRKIIQSIHYQIHSFNPSAGIVLLHAGGKHLNFYKGVHSPHALCRYFCLGA
jgi:hypothetical protein